MTTPSPMPPERAPASMPSVLSVGALPEGTRLAEFELRGVLGEGGFATVYRAYDHSLRRTIAIKEYMPGALATRAADGGMAAREAGMQAGLARGLESFLDEARLLAQFDHPALIRVYRFWEQNRTAYIAMQLIQGRTLRALREAEPRLVASEAWLKHMLSPILDALELLHASHCYHRDISPDNIMVLDSGVPMLLDFGAARQALGDATQALTVIVKPGYAPIEQYDSVLEQGPWTDVYSLGAVLHYLITGKPVTASVSRLLKDPLPKLAEMPGLGISPAFARAIDRALTVHPDERIRSVAEFREALTLPTFWADMHRQSVELGALRSDTGNTGFAPLPDEPGLAIDTPEAAHPATQAHYHAAEADALAAANVPHTDALGTVVRARRKQPRLDMGERDARSAAQRPGPGPAPAAPATRLAALAQSAQAALRRADPRLALTLGLGTAVAVAVALAAALRPASPPHDAPTPVATTPAPTPAPAPASDAPATPAAPPAPAAPPVAEAPATQGVGAQLLLDVYPWGVVYVDGAMKGLTPPLKQLWLQPGTHTVEVRNADLPAYSQTVTIRNGQDVKLQHEFN
ncbi:MAG: serine/threonine-protein kinase [Pseudomonadota bacterium]|nr:serine/threonine-protein kinase [Pseudomonadota bacterium]